MAADLDGARKATDLLQSVLRQLGPPDAAGRELTVDELRSLGIVPSSGIEQNEFDFGMIRHDHNAAPEPPTDGAREQLQSIVNIRNQLILKVWQQLKADLGRRKQLIANGKEAFEYGNPLFTYKLEQYYQSRLDQAVADVCAKAQDACNAVIARTPTHALTKEQADDLLNSVFAVNANPSSELRWKLAAATHRQYKQINTWFCNKRTRSGKTNRRQSSNSLSRNTTAMPESPVIRAAERASSGDPEPNMPVRIPIPGPVLHGTPTDAMITEYAAKYHQCLEDPNAEHDGVFGFSSDSGASDSDEDDTAANTFRSGRPTRQATPEVIE